MWQICEQTKLHRQTHVMTSPPPSTGRAGQQSELIDFWTLHIHIIRQGRRRDRFCREVPQVYHVFFRNGERSTVVHYCITLMPPFFSRLFELSTVGLRNMLTNGFSSIYFFAIISVDCEWSRFSDWSECSVSCGGGIQRRRRTVLVEAERGGRRCIGRSEETRICNSKLCPTPAGAN